jgi:hypothetical protein
VLSDLSGRFAEAGEVHFGPVWCAGRFAIVVADLVLLVGLTAFPGRSLHRAVPVYGARPAGDSDVGVRAASMSGLLDAHAPDAQIC